MVAQGSSLPTKSFVARLEGFVKKPWSGKLQSLALRLVTVVPLPVRLPSGVWWLAENDCCGRAILGGGAENVERRFVERILQPGMNVLDIGAHHGLYTLLASRKVGAGGRVVAFEPSPRERRKLLRHLRLNRCANVQVEACALGSKQGEADLFVVDGVETGCNSLRPPNVAEPTRRVPVSVLTLDSCLPREKMQKVDFIKLDVEGAEIEVLKGAEQLLARQPRPVFLCEVQDIRTAPWGYPAGEIIDFLRRRGYHWFVPTAGGGLQALPLDQTCFDGNFVAVSEERLPEMERFSQRPSERGGLSSLA